MGKNETRDLREGRFTAKIGSIPVTQQTRDTLERIAQEEHLTLDDVARQGFRLRIKQAEQENVLNQAQV